MENFQKEYNSSYLGAYVMFLKIKVIDALIDFEPLTFLS